MQLFALPHMLCSALAAACTTVIAVNVLREYRAYHRRSETRIRAYSQAGLPCRRPQHLLTRTKTPPSPATNVRFAPSFSSIRPRGTLAPRNS